MFGGDRAKEYGRNRLLPLDDGAQEEIKLSIAYSARKRIFSKTELSSSDVHLITRARKDRAADVAEN